MSIADNFQDIFHAIRRAERLAGREADSVGLVAVTKTQSAEAINAALATGHRIFGENKVQEAQLHWTGLRGVYPDLRLHLIGPLQSNKAGDAVALFDVIETIDREKIARTIGDEMRGQGRDLECFIQVNTGEEPQKAGIAPSDLNKFLSFCRDECTLNITGLMCIPPANEPAGLHFAFMRQLARENGLGKLSMGMSGDFEKAIANGATHVRIGSALFGPRLA